jgi:hypothetical protein
MSAAYVNDKFLFVFPFSLRNLVYVCATVINDKFFVFLFLSFTKFGLDAKVFKKYKRRYIFFFFFFFFVFWLEVKYRRLICSKKNTGRWNCIILCYVMCVWHKTISFISKHEGYFSVLYSTKLDNKNSGQFSGPLNTLLGAIGQVFWCPQNLSLFLWPERLRLGRS